MDDGRDAEAADLLATFKVVAFVMMAVSLLALAAIAAVLYVLWRLFA